MNGNCYFSEGLNPSVTCNKNEGNRIAIPVIDAGRINKTQNGRRLKEDGDESFTLTGQDRHGVAIGPIETNGYNATLKAGGGVTQTALALNARDYKGLSGSNQMMTAAILCLPSTKDSDPKKGKSQTASKPEKIEDYRKENERGH